MIGVLPGLRSRQFDEAEAALSRHGRGAMGQMLVSMTPPHGRKYVAIGTTWGMGG
jgi:hypothetical protein